MIMNRGGAMAHPGTVAQRALNLAVPGHVLVPDLGDVAASPTDEARSYIVDYGSVFDGGGRKSGAVTPHGVLHSTTHEAECNGERPAHLPICQNHVVEHKQRCRVRDIYFLYFLWRCRKQSAYLLLTPPGDTECLSPSPARGREHGGAR